MAARILDFNKISKFKYQAGINIFELLIFWLALATAGWIASNIDSGYVLIDILAVACGFFIYFLPTVYFHVRDGHKNKLK